MVEFPGRMELSWLTPMIHKAGTESQWGHWLAQGHTVEMSKIL